jgi:hypothetical protein
LAGFIVLCCLGFLISLPSSAASDVPSSVPSSSAHEDGGPNAPAPDGNYPLMLAEEVQQTERHPVNASLLTMLLVVTVASFGASVLLFLATNARRQGAICSWSVAEDRPWMAAAHEGPSFLGVFRL